MTASYVDYYKKNNIEINQEIFPITKNDEERMDTNEIEMDHYFDQRGRPEKNLLILQETGGIPFEGYEIEFNLWRKTRELFSNLYPTHTNICKKYIKSSYMDLKDLQKKLMGEYENTNLNEIIYLQEETKNVKENLRQRNEIRHIAQQYSTKYYELEPGYTIDKLKQTLDILKDGASVKVIGTNYEVSDIDALSLDHAVVVTNYSSKRKSFYIKDSHATIIKS